MPARNHQKREPSELISAKNLRKTAAYFDVQPGEFIGILTNISVL
jgi:hypothetical protein